MGFGEHIHKVKNSDTATFDTPIEDRVMQAPTILKRPEERELAVEQQRIKFRRDGHSFEVRKFYSSVACLWEVRPHEEAQVFVHDLNQFVTVQLFEETPAVRSLGKFCGDNGYSYEWSAVKSHDWPRMGRLLFARQTISYLLSFQGYHRICREEKQNKLLETELLRVHLQVLRLSEVKNKPPREWSWNP